MNGVRLSFGYYYIYSIHSVCIHETSCIPMNCIYSAHLLSKFLEELGVWIQNLQKWPTDGVIKLLRWELGQMMWSMWYRPVQVLDDERLYFDRDSLKWRSRVASPYITKHHLFPKDSIFAISLTWVWNMFSKNSPWLFCGFWQITPKEVPHEFSTLCYFSGIFLGILSFIKQYSQIFQLQTGGIKRNCCRNLSNNDTMCYLLA